MPSVQSRTGFFESIIGDCNIPEAQVLIFFSQAYKEKEGEPEEQLRLLDLLVEHRPDLEEEAAKNVIRGY